MQYSDRQRQKQKQKEVGTFFCGGQIAFSRIVPHLHDIQGDGSPENPLEDRHNPVKAAPDTPNVAPGMPAVSQETVDATSGLPVAQLSARQQQKQRQTEVGIVYICGVQGCFLKYLTRLEGIGQSFGR